MNEIICGDCREYIKSIPRGAFLVSDPPYNIKYHYNQEYKDNLEERDYRELLQMVFAGKKSTIILYPEETITILGTSDLGRLHEVVSWVYPSNTAKQHRLISWWNCAPDFNKIPQPYRNPKDKRIKERMKQKKMARGYDWWEINQVKNVSKKHSHTCPIPEEVARRIILSTTEENDIIVDPFAGSGTVLKVAKELNRRFVGIDISQEYCSIAEARVKKVQKPLL